MNIDLLPLVAFAGESPTTAERPQGDVHTLTLRPGWPAPHSLTAVMSGNVSIDAAPAQPQSPWRAAVVPAAGPVLTITF